MSSSKRPNWVKTLAVHQYNVMTSLVKNMDYFEISQVSHFKHQRQQSNIVLSYPSFHGPLPHHYNNFRASFKEAGMPESQRLLNCQNRAQHVKTQLLHFYIQTRPWVDLLSLNTDNIWQLAAVCTSSVCICSIVCVSVTCMCALWGIMEGKNTPRCMWCNYTLDYLIG